jgi:hypothetical protein
MGGGTEDKLLAQAEANGYRMGAYREEDSVRDRHKHVKKTVEEHNKVLKRYVLCGPSSPFFPCLSGKREFGADAEAPLPRWNLLRKKMDCAREGRGAPDEDTVREQCLGKGVEAPDLATVKDFLRFRAASGRGLIDKKITADSLQTFAESFFAGFTRVTGTPTDEGERSDVFNVS